MAQVNSYPRESVEFQAVLLQKQMVGAGGQAVQVPVDDDDDVWGHTTLQVAPYGSRPSDAWIAPVRLDDEWGLMVQGMDRGTYRVWAKVSDNPEIPVIDAGVFLVS
jgi:hypothetical protein